MAPQPSMPPLSIRAEGGLCNKLRVILSYRLAAMDEGRHLIVVWANGGPCPALWEDLFEPLDGVTVVSTDSPSLRAALAPMSLEECAVPSEFGTHPRIAGTPREAQMYSLLRPKPSILRAIEDAIARCKDGSDDGRFLAMHIRRTDYTTTFGLSTPDHAFENFLEMHLVNGSSSSSKSTARALIRPRAGDEAATTAAMASCAYLATDNGETQQHFQSLFGDERIRTHIAINTMRHTETLRHTTVADAVVDLYTCAAAYVFKGTLGSSFSDTIWLMRKARGSSNEHDELESDDSFQRRIAKHSRSTVRPGECGLLIDLPLPKRDAAGDSRAGAIKGGGGAGTIGGRATSFCMDARKRLALIITPHLQCSAPLPPPISTTACHRPTSRTLSAARIGCRSLHRHGRATA